MDFVDYYKVLNINKSASPKDIKEAYRKLARKFHPDLNPDNNQAKNRFQEINEANEVLSDPAKRKKYDRYGKDWEHAEEFERQKQAQHSDSQRGSRPSSGAASGDFSDFFESMFGGSARQSRPAKYRGEDYSTDIQLNLLEAYKTHKQTLNVNGKTIRITIPAGVENGQKIKISGHGGVGANGAPNGDLYIHFLVSNHPTIKRLGNNLFTNVELDICTAVLGGEITIDTLDGKVKLKVKPETQTGTKVNLKGKGFPVYKSDGHLGDLQITYSVKTPRNLTAHQKELFAELQKTMLEVNH